MIRFDNVSKHFLGQKNALSNVTVTIADGEFVFLIGPSGAGKTTLLRLLLRDIIPTSGAVYLDDADITAWPKSKIYLLRRKVGMIFQDFKLLTDRTIYENVAIGLEILGKPQPEIEKGVTDVLNLVGLADKIHLFPVQLSAGELQRASIARAIVAGPKVLLADEPTGNLDPQTAADIFEILQEVNKIGTTVIIATHNATIVNELKKRTIILRDGAVVSDEQKGRYHMPKRDKDDKNPPEEHNRHTAKAGKA
jgi:cell division transport system ATP-binding protein